MAGLYIGQLSDLSFSVVKLLKAVRLSGYVRIQCSIVVIYC